MAGADAKTPTQDVPAVAGHAPAAGTRLGSYELVQRIGRGGMGEVWEAVLHGPAGFRKPVALKLLTTERLADTRVRDALITEARLGARLQHPNVVGTLALSEHDGRWMVALELVRGASLDALLRETCPFPPHAALDVGAQAARGLHHAHRAGLVHRDIKPANILVDRTGLVRVADLGISVLSGVVGQPAGTPGYLAPECMERAPGDPRSDVFALGCTIYKLVTGKRPFGGGPAALGAVHRVERLLDAGLAQPADDAVPGLGPVVHRCLRADPADRWASAAALADAFSGLMDRQPHRGESLVSLLSRARPELVVEDAPSSRGASTRLRTAGNIPAPRDAFVGRASEIEEIRSLVVDPLRRLVVLLGFGGVGKTRLALEVARSARSAFPGGAWFFRLEDAHTKEAVCGAVARGLGIQIGGSDPARALANAMQARGRALFVLDNLEQCLEHLPATLGCWLDRATEATFLCTSRCALRMRGEFRVPLGSLASADAAALFDARTARPLHDDERALLPALCAALDELPLAIELCAARVDLLGVEGILARLSTSGLLGGGPDLPARQRTMEASLAWSVDLLSPRARAGLADLTVFHGGFEIEAVFVVLEHEDEALEILRELVDASLVAVDAAHHRFGMLSVVLDHASRDLDPERRVRLERRHGAHYGQGGGREAMEALRRRGGSEGRARRMLDLDNIIAACQRSAARGDARIAVDCLCATWGLLSFCGPLPLIAAMAMEVLAIPGLDDRDRARAYRIAAAAHGEMGKRRVAVSHGAAALAAASRLDDAESELWGRICLARAQLTVGEMDEARAHLDRCLTHPLAHADRALLGAAHSGMGSLDASEGRLHDAWTHLSEALRLFQLTGDGVAEAHCMTRLASLRVRLDPHQTRAMLEEAIAIQQELGHLGGEAAARRSLANVHIQRLELDEAEAHLRASLALTRPMGDLDREGNVLDSLCRVHYLRGDVDEAARHAEASVAIFRETGSRRREGGALMLWSKVAVAAGHFDEARALTSRALALHEEIGDLKRSAQCLAHLADLQRMLGNYGVARERCQVSFARYREAGIDVEGSAHHIMGDIALCSGQYAEALRHLACALASARASGDRMLEWESLVLQARCHRQTHGLAAARECVDRALSMVDAFPSASKAVVYLEGARQSLAEGDRSAAEAMLPVALVHARTAGQVSDLAMVLAQAAELSAMSGDASHAASLLEEARTVGPRGHADVGRELARVGRILREPANTGDG